MKLDHYVTLGRSGLRVSPLCLGTMTFGEEWGWGAPPDVCHAMLRRYVQAGGNFIDTANGYTKGHSEVILGDWMASDEVRRDSLVIATKFLVNLYRGDPNGGGAGRKAIVQQCENSLRRLRTDHIDLYWQHAPDPFTPIEETLRAIDDLVTAGKVRYFGLSDMPAWAALDMHMTARMHGWTAPVALQLEHSLLRRSVEGELMPMAIAKGLGVTPWGPLAGGLLSGKYSRERDPSTSDRGWHGPPVTEAEWQVLDRVREVAAAHDTTVAAVALAWLCHQPGVTSPIIGVRSVAQLDANLAALALDLDESELAELSALTQPDLPFPHRVLAMLPLLMQNGATVNGEVSPIQTRAPANDAPW